MLEYLASWIVNYVIGPYVDVLDSKKFTVGYSMFNFICLFNIMAITCYFLKNTIYSLIYIEKLNKKYKI